MPELTEKEKEAKGNQLQQPNNHRSYYDKEM